MPSEDNDRITLAVIGERTQSLQNSVDKIITKLDKHYVTQIEFRPIKMIVFGMVGLILVSVCTGVVALIINVRP